MVVALGFLLALTGCSSGGGAAPAGTTSTSTAVTTTTSTSTSTTTSVPSPVSTQDVRVPTGRVSVRTGDVFVAREDGDLWLLSGATSDAPPARTRLLDLADPRVRSAEGPGANRVESIAGPIDGTVFYTDCCEPAAGNLRAFTEPGGERIDLAPGGRVALRPDGRALATVNRYALAVFDVGSARQTTRSFTDEASQIADEADVIWSGDGTSLLVLDAGVDRIRLARFAATGLPDPLASVEIAIPTRSSSSWVRFAGRTSSGAIVVALREPDATRFLAFDLASLTTVDAGIARIDGPVSSVQVGPDGRSVLWVAGGVLSYRAADGRLRSTGAGIAAAWFAAA